MNIVPDPAMAKACCFRAAFTYDCYPYLERMASEIEELCTKLKDNFTKYLNDQGHKIYYVRFFPRTYENEGVDCEIMAVFNTGFASPQDMKKSLIRWQHINELSFYSDVYGIEIRRRSNEDDTY